ncbi:tripartite tricarboxylate transporter TctB family protein [Chloroflexota bacterium]
MKIYRKGSFWFTVLISIIALMFIVGAFDYGDRARLVPILVGIPTLLLGMLVLISEKYPRLISGFDISVEDFTPKDEEIETRFKQEVVQHSTKGVLTIYSWMWGFFILVFLVGFLIAVPVSTFLYIKLRERTGWLKALVISIGIGGLIYLGFEILIGTILFEGILFGAIIIPLWV